MNNRLIIIGNGFDLDHGLNTSYSGFRDFLLDTKYKDNPLYIPAPLYENNFDEDQLKNFIYRKIQGYGDKEWNDFEERLSDLNFDDDLISSFGDGDSNPFHQAEDNTDNMSNAVLAFSHLTELFIQWLTDVYDEYISEDDDCIEKKAKSEFSSLLTNDTEILDFNYTDTVEDVYNFNNTYPIHGTLDSGYIILGHSQSPDDALERWGRFIGAEDALVELESSLYKDTEGIITESTNFFDDLHDIKEIYTYGFSFSDVDMPYISEVIAKVSQNATWFLHGSDVEIRNKDYYEKKLRSNHFLGNIKLWS